MAWVLIARACSQGYNIYHVAENWKKKTNYMALSYPVILTYKKLHLKKSTGFSKLFCQASYQA